MFPWASLISLGGQAVGGILSAMNNRKQQRAADAEAARQQAYYESKANEDALSRSENRQMLAQYDRKAKEQVENARNTAAITGATPEYGLAVQEAVAEGRADLMGDMVAGQSAREEKYLEQAEGVRQQKYAADMAREAAKQQSYANLMANSASAFGSMVGGYKAKQQAPAAVGPADVDGNAAKKSTLTAPNYTPQTNKMLADTYAPIQASAERVKNMKLFG